MFTKFLASAVIVTCVSLSAASAATVSATFKLKGVEGNAVSHSYFKKGLGLTVTAYNHTNGLLGDQISVDERKRGMGALSAGSNAGKANSGNLQEMIVFSFDQKVKVKKLKFSFYDANDQFVIAKYKGPGMDLAKIMSELMMTKELYADGNLDGSGGDTGILRLKKGQRFSGRTFGIGTAGDASDFRIKSIKVFFDDGSGVLSDNGSSDGDNLPSQVPVPAAGWLMMAAVGGLAALRRRRKA